MTRLSGNNSNNMMLLVGTLVAALLIGLALFAVSKKQSTPAAGGEGTFNYASLPYAGQEDAKVSVVVVEDFKCPICKQFEETVAPQIKTNYVDTGKIKQYSLVWPFLSKNAGLSVDDSKFAAQAGRCVYQERGNDGFNAFKTILFRAQGDERQAWATKERLKELAVNVEGLDQAKFATCLDTDATVAAVDTDTKMAEDNKVSGTPTVFVNGKRVENSMSYDELKKAIDEALQ
ncbi:DsbA family protein [Deinococcus fonticola]|uniref:DsbA family protein n=1 Tax=Deinococcus fonticola TaxID=2528713 RepID=UPI001074EC27|nr:thioredoxin domain-containing protein [Deinococcus fonticola]